MQLPAVGRQGEVGQEAGDLGVKPLGTVGGGPLVPAVVVGGGFFAVDPPGGQPMVWRWCSLTRRAALSVSWLRADLAAWSAGWIGGAGTMTRRKVWAV